MILRRKPDEIRPANFLKNYQRKNWLKGNKSEDRNLKEVRISSFGFCTRTGKRAARALCRPFHYDSTALKKPGGTTENLNARMFFSNGKLLTFDLSFSVIPYVIVLSEFFLCSSSSSFLRLEKTRKRTTTRTRAQSTCCQISASKPFQSLNHKPTPITLTSIRA